jgi:hypothetical protein
VNVGAVNQTVTFAPGHLFAELTVPQKEMATKRPDQSHKDWRKVVGMFRVSEFMRKVDEECLRGREAEREAARRGELDE